MCLTACDPYKSSIFDTFGTGSMKRMKWFVKCIKWLYQDEAAAVWWRRLLPSIILSCP